MYSTLPFPVRRLSTGIQLAAITFLHDNNTKFPFITNDFLCEWAVRTVLERVGGVSLLICGGEP